MNKHRGSTFDSFLKEEEMLGNIEALAIKRVIAYELAKKIKKTHLSKLKVAKKIGTSRSALDRLLDPNNTSVTLHTLIKAAHFMGKKLRISLV
jgi:antitoxin HicB